MKRAYTILGIVCTVLVVASCRDTTIDPFNNDNRLFTVYGYLNPLDTLQTIRIIPVSRSSDPISGSESSANTIDAEVFSIDLSDFTVKEWVHSLKQFPDNSFGHFFTGNFEVRAGHTYRLVITKVDGSTTTAQTTVPNDPDNILVIRSDPRLDPALGLVQDVTLPGDRDIWDFQTLYRLQGGGVSGRIIVPFHNQSPAVGTGPWTITLPIGQDQAVVAAALNGSELENIPANLRLTSMGLLFRIVDRNWSAYLVQTDDELLSRSNQPSNVLHGAGFWGSMGLLLHEWEVPLDLSQALGYDS